MIPMEFSLGPLAPEHLSEFVVGLVLAIIVAVGVQKIAVPRFEKMYEERAEAIEGGINRAQVIKQEAEETKRHYQEQLASSREEAAGLREQARAQAAQIIEAARKEAEAEAARIRRSAELQISNERAQAYNELRSDIGSLAVQLSERVIGESLADSQAASRTVDRFLAELDAQPSRVVPDFVPDALAGPSGAGTQ
ncbi:F0F1 ATP synthase subunit B [Brooklawnia sp.]|uniref:F0F1 ATP synthase subunit B n=1 Tax=Brooklawnia sp. TaxID=2699740 RepID=UPI00311E7E5A